MHLIPAPGYSFAAEFDVGLDLLLDVFAARLGKRTGRGGVLEA